MITDSLSLHNIDGTLIPTADMTKIKIRLGCAPIHGALYSIAPYQRLTPRYVFPLSIPWGLINPKEGLASFTHYPGGLAHPRENYHLSYITLGDFQPLERIITSNSLYPGELSPYASRGYYLLPCNNLGDYKPLDRIYHHHS